MILSTWCAEAEQRQCIRLCALSVSRCGDLLSEERTWRVCVCVCVCVQGELSELSLRGVGEESGESREREGD